MPMFIFVYSQMGVNINFGKKTSLNPTGRLLCIRFVKCRENFSNKEYESPFNRRCLRWKLCWSLAQNRQWWLSIKWRSNNYSSKLRNNGWKFKKLDIFCLFSQQKSLDWLCERAILTTTNNKAAEINNIIIQSVDDVEKQYKSVDTVLSTDDAVHYPTEFLNSLDPPGLPPNTLSLKIGVPVMLLRNLNPPKLCNGTRFQVKGLHKNLIEATVLTGCARGETVFIPRIPLMTSNYPFEFKRLQFLKDSR